MTAVAALAAANTRQIIVEGSVRNSITGVAVDDARLTLAFAPDAGAAFAPLSATLSRHAGGWFAFALSPHEWRAPTGEARFRVTAMRPDGSGATQMLVLDPADLALTQGSRSIGGQTATLHRITAAPFRIDLAIAPPPVRLVGHVLLSGDPERPASGATIDILGPGSVPVAPADADGRFVIAAFPLVASATLRFTRNAVTTERPFRPEYRQQTNTAVFAIA